MPFPIPNLVAWILFVALAVCLWKLRGLRLAREAVRAAHRVKSDFASNMNHELRTPLNGILGAIELLAGTSLDTKQRELAAIIRGSSESLLALIDSVFDFARIEAGEVRPQHIRFDLRECLDDAVRPVRERAVAKGLSMEIRVAAETPRFVMGDPSRLRQIITNLGNNAVKFTERGQVRLEVAPAAEPSLRALYFRMVDTGIGIRPEVAGRLFRPFTQGDSGSARRYGGTGLGLATARCLVQLMKGSIGLESELGRGSTFWFLLPWEIAAPEPLAQPDQPSKGNILIVDDNPVNQMVTAGAVKRLGYEAEVAGGGEAALAAYARHQFDAILLDCQMPVMDGYQTAAALRLLEDGKRRVPIIAITANPVEGDQEKCVACGMDDYLSKPIRMTVLGAALGRWTRLPQFAGLPGCESPVFSPAPLLFENSPHD